jgi:RNA recognition motif-containing protein
MKHGRLFVGNLSYLVTRADLEALFKPFGEVASIGFKSKAGHAFVAMATPGMAEKALEKLHGTMFKGRVLAVTPEVSRKQAKTAAVAKIVKKRRRPKQRPEQALDTDDGAVPESRPASGFRGRPAKRPGARTVAGPKRARFEKTADGRLDREPKGPHGPRGPRAKDPGRPVGDGPKRDRFEKADGPTGERPRNGRPEGSRPARSPKGPHGKGPGRPTDDKPRSGRFEKAAGHSGDRPRNGRPEGSRPASGPKGPHGKGPGRPAGERPRTGRFEKAEGSRPASGPKGPHGSKGPHAKKPGRRSGEGFRGKRF